MGLVHSKIGQAWGSKTIVHCVVDSYKWQAAMGRPR